MSKNNCNHCLALKQSAEASIRLELKLKEALEHIKDKELMELDYIVKINNLEQQKAEMIECLESAISQLLDAKYDFQYSKELLEELKENQ